MTSVISRLVPASYEERWLTLGNLVNMTGTGAVLSMLTVYLATVKGMSVEQAGSVLAVAGLVGILGGIPSGHIGDRYGPREVAAILEIICLVAVLGLVFATSLWFTMVCLGVLQLATSGNNAARDALIARLVPEDRRTALLAYQRSVLNVGFAIGAALAGLAIAAGPAALTVVLVLDAATFAFGVYATLRLPTAVRQPGRRSRGTEAWTDLPFLSCAVLNALHSINRAVVSVGVPLWIVYESPLPKWAVSAAFILNTALVIGMQVPVARFADRAGKARWALTVAGLCSAGGCLAIASTVHNGIAVYWLALTIATVLLAFGEMTGAAAGWTLSFAFASPRMFGQYQGVWQTFADTSVKVAGPALMAVTVTIGAGWPMLAVAFVAVSASTPPVVSRAVRAAHGRRQL